MESTPASPGASGLRGILFPDPPRKLWGERWAQVLTRALHITVMALVVGGLARGADHKTLMIAIVLTVVSGVILLGIDLAKSGLILTQGSGVAVLLKLGLVGVGLLHSDARLEWYLAATVVASIGSHMPGRWRHFSWLAWRVVEPGPKRSRDAR